MAVVAVVVMMAVVEAVAENVWMPGAGVGVSLVSGADADAGPRGSPAATDDERSQSSCLRL
eukprot:2870512-Pleurochrysis_carterae.AAC.1